MLKHATAATTRTVRRGGDSRDRPESLLTAAEIVSSPETGLAYRIQHLLGEGGFGQVYLANRIGRSAEVPETVCIKVSRRIDGWLREAYFGQLLDGHPRAIRVFDAFPLLRPDGRILYSLALEYASHGDLSAFLSRTSKGWSEAAARREIAGILEVLGKLHRGTCSCATDGASSSETSASCVSRATGEASPRAR
jgi:serine/threonine protein kinase